MSLLPKGFFSDATSAGLKTSGALDLTLIENQGPRFDGAAVFTSNQIVAAPVLWSKEVIKGKSVKAVVLNSGGANACTGPQGFIDTHHTAEKIGELLSISAAEVIVCSTGIIGEYLPMEKIMVGLNSLALNSDENSVVQSARAIMTTDTEPKIATHRAQEVDFVGIAKGAGMLAPALATMLCVVMSDADVSRLDIQSVLSRVSDKTFNRIDSDGCTSTNDTVLLMTSGASGIEMSELDFELALMEICGSLAQQLVADAEGSTKTISITVNGAKNDKDALEVARSCARNNLLKCAIFGRDPNWGRVLAAVGTADAYLDPQAIDVYLNGVHVARKSAPGEDKNLVSFSDREVNIVINLNVGDSTVTVLTNDLSHDYVHENSAYSS
ncbi:unannotated protein [freshwater metagenome]|uniref:Unannotated protein n=1 Tax=freshwater metagenome TaxID=449393 RepID=A0A6J7XUL3_9ZZZZ|nr:bifunctional glutamate N-acetyltransferase/amino-acid acetyltransferase ArgJ [Actinomycetota bacterium]